MATPGTDTARTAAKSVIDLLQFNQGLFTRAIATAQEESLNFVNQRLQANRETIEKARAARGLDSFLTVQREWMMESARDYMQHSMRFADRMMELAEKGREEGEERVQAASESFRTSAARDVGRTRDTFRQAAKSTGETFKSTAEKAAE